MSAYSFGGHDTPKRSNQTQEIEWPLTYGSSAHSPNDNRRARTLFAQLHDGDVATTHI